jgi:hypothetical protein
MTADTVTMNACLDEKNTKHYQKEQFKDNDIERRYQILYFIVLYKRFDDILMWLEVQKCMKI